ncbi:MAG: LysM peptidoglycan-binding domain-containing protein [Deltaproteobacteria bacterium]|nr:LysM peptidoglycan-binding domain-containing protein [Deltaproteobacteria bacterium]
MGGGDYVVVRGDTLWGIARRTYGDGSKWREIARANPTQVFRDGELILVGSVLRLPTINAPAADEGGSGTPAAPVSTQPEGGDVEATLPRGECTEYGDFNVYPTPSSARSRQTPTAHETCVRRSFTRSSPPPRPRRTPTVSRSKGRSTTSSPTACLTGRSPTATPRGRWSCSGGSPSPSSASPSAGSPTSAACSTTSRRAPAPGPRSRRCSWRSAPIG